MEFFRAAARAQFEQDTKEIKYFSLLPPGRQAADRLE
jgi:hypothetical protein